MQNPQNFGSSSGQTPPSQPLLQNSSLVTQSPSQEHYQFPPLPGLKSDQKLLLPPKPSLAQLDSQGGIRINITIPASTLTLIKLLGEGAYGSVYEGVWNEQPVAIKRLKAQHLTEKAIEELRQEAQIMFQLGVESKYIVPLKKICMEAPHYSLVMELMPKGSLYQLLHNGQPLPWPIRFQIALDMAWGLKDLHGYSILHRDLKSLNILLDDRLRAKLADFGLAKVKQETSSQSSVAKGTVLWMAPELFKRKTEVTAAADIWSLGMVLWELSSREIPFKDAQNQLQAMGWIKDGEKEEIPADCPAELKPIIESCWNLTPSNRPTAIQVIERLKPLIVTDEKQKTTQLVSPLIKDQRKPKATTDLKDEEMKENKAKASIPKLPNWDNLSPEMRISLFTPMKEKLEHRQVEELKNKLPLTSPKKEQELKKVTPLPSLSGSLQTLMPTPKTVIPRLDRGIQKMEEVTLKQLLQFVAEGEQDKAEELIKQDKNLLLQAGTVKDLSGREFKQITAFQYALWAMDWHMWTMIQKYLPKEAQAEQFQALETKSTAHGKHFNLQGLTGALQTYVRGGGGHWCEIGVEQKALPVHVVNEYCRLDRPFEPCPLEWEAKLPRTREFEIWDSTQLKYVKYSWFIPSSSKEDLGLTYAFYRYNFGGVFKGDKFGSPHNFEVVADLKALQSLWKTRTQQLESLKFQLFSTVRQNQGLKIELKEQKYETPIQSPKLTPPISQIIPQTILAPSKSKATSEQFALQDQLIAACKQGDDKAVTALLRKGAKPDVTNEKGEQPLGAAVWGMCPDVVYTLLKQAGGIASLTWAECEEHNLRHYKKVFILPEFNPQTHGEWSDLLQEMASNLFLCEFYVKKVGRSWDNWREVALRFSRDRSLTSEYTEVLDASKRGYESYRAQVKQAIQVHSSEQKEKPKPVRMLKQLLQYVVEGEQDEAEALIRQNHDVLLLSGTAQDLSGREFKQITAFQYALWALDWHMWSMIKKYLPEEQQRKQFAALNSEGTAHGRHFSFKPLIDALQTYIDKADADWNWGTRADDHWRNVVGGAQQLLPVHVVNEYCHPSREFRPCPDFEKDTLPRYRKCKTNHPDVWNNWDSWYPALRSKKGAFIRLGSSIAVFSTDNIKTNKELHRNIRYNSDSKLYNIDRVLNVDVLALQYLSKTRIEQLNLLASQLKLSSPNLTLEQKELTTLSQDSSILTASSSPPIPPVDKKSLLRLLQFVAEGEQEQAELMLKGKPSGMLGMGEVKANPSLLLHHGTVTDLSNRTFENITAFQYALWALDWHLWRMIQKYLPEQAQAEQFVELESKGTAYGKHFSLDTLIGALQMYQDKSKEWKEGQLTNHWRKAVGGAQRLLPVHVVNEYCRSDIAFTKNFFFLDIRLPRVRKCDKGDWFTGGWSGLGKNFAWAPGFGLEGSDVIALDSGISSVENQVKSLKCLAKARAMQLELLSFQLTQGLSFSSVAEEKQPSSTASSSNSKTVSISVTASTSQSSHTLMPAPKSSTSTKAIDPRGSINITNSLSQTSS